MDPTAEIQNYQSDQPVDTHHQTDFEPVDNQQVYEQDSSNRNWSQNYHQGPYPNSINRIRQRGGFHQRGRYLYNNRGGNQRPSQRHRNNFNQHSNGSTDNQQGSATSYSRNFNSLYRPSMLEDPWLNLKPVKVPSNGTSLIFDTNNK